MYHLVLLTFDAFRQISSFFIKILENLKNLNYSNKRFFYKGVLDFMDLHQQLKDLSQKYSFENVRLKKEELSPYLEVCLQLQEEHIEKFIEKAGQINSIVESCANMVSIFDDSASKEVLMQTSLRCAGRDTLYISTTPSMVKILIETLFD